MNQFTLRSRIFFVSSVATLTLLVVAIGLIFTLSHTHTKPPETTVTNLVNSIPLQSTFQDSTASGIIAGYDHSEPQVTIEELIKACPDPFERGYNGFGGLSEQCVSLLEPFFIELPYIPKDGFQWLKFTDRISYRRIFEDPIQDRELVLDALSRAECRFEEGEVIRPDLREVCHADSFYVYWSFVEICKGHRNSRNLREDYDLYSSRVVIKATAELWDAHVTELATGDDDHVNTAQYTRLKEDVWHTALTPLWYQRKCKDYDLSSIMLSSNERDLEYFNILASIGQRLGIYPLLGEEHGNDIFDSDTYFILSVMAAHFGEYSATVLYSSHRIGTHWFQDRWVSPDLVSANRQQHSWMKYFPTASNLSTFGQLAGDLQNAGVLWGDTEYNKDYVYFVERSIDGLLELDKAGVEYDLAALVDQLCRRLTEFDRKDGDGVRDLNCRDAIEELNLKPKISFKKGLKLDEFKKIAVELGVWD